MPPSARKTRTTEGSSQKKKKKKKKIKEEQVLSISCVDVVLRESKKDVLLYKFASFQSVR